MDVFILIVLVLALACFVGEVVRSRSLIAAGLALWVIIPLVNVIRSLTGR